MNYLRSFISFTCIALLVFSVSCRSGSKDNKENTSDTIANKGDTSSSTTNTGSANNANDAPAKTSDASDTKEGILPKDLVAHLKKSMPDWQIIPKEKWLGDDYRKVVDPDNKLAYEKSVFIEGDFNGDKANDYACFLINTTTQQVKLMAFHAKQDGFDAVEITDEGKMTQGSIGAGIVLQAAGGTATLEGKSLKLTNQAVAFQRYGKSSLIYYYKDGKYVETFTGD